MKTVKPIAPLYDRAAFVILSRFAGADIGGRKRRAPSINCTASPTCRIELPHDSRREVSRTACTAGSSSARRIPMIAITTSNSTRVKP